MRLVRGAALTMIAMVPLFAQEPTGKAILSHLAEGFQGISDYTVHLEASVDMERLQVPSMSATMYFKAPDKIHFESSTFAMLPREGLSFNPADLQRNFEGEYAGEDTVDGIPCLKVRLIPRSEDSRHKPLMLSVDSSRWVVMQLRSQPFEGRRIVARFTYLRVEAAYWLPETLEVSFEAVTPPSEAGVTLPEVPQDRRNRRAPLRQGSIRVVYSDYKLNTGLSDDVFEERKERP